MCVCVCLLSKTLFYSVIGIYSSRASCLEVTATTVHTMTVIWTFFSYLDVGDGKILIARLTCGILWNLVYYSLHNV